MASSAHAGIISARNNYRRRNAIRDAWTDGSQVRRLLGPPPGQAPCSRSVSFDSPVPLVRNFVYIALFHGMWELGTLVPWAMLFIGFRAGAQGL